MVSEKEALKGFFRHGAQPLPGQRFGCALVHLVRATPWETMGPFAYMGHPLNPRYKNPARRNALRKKVAALGLPCHICGGEIDYTLPPRDPMAYELDEIVPVSKYWLGGYRSASEAALDPGNVAPAHRICNERRGNRLMDAPPPESSEIEASEW